MADQLQDHEKRLATLEGEMKSVATKADLAELKHELTQFVHNAIKDQTEVMQRAFDEVNKALKNQSDEIRELREKESRLSGVADTLKIALPFLISIIAVLVAIFK